MPNPKWVKGISGNPKGRPKTSVKDLVKSHPQAHELVSKLFDVAMDDADKRQISAWRILLPKMVPDLKAQTLEVEQKNITGVIVLPQKVGLDPAKVSTLKQSESVTISDALPESLPKSQADNGQQSATIDSAIEEESLTS